MKKISSLLLIVIMVLLVGCGSKKESAPILDSRADYFNNALDADIMFLRESIDLYGTNTRVIDEISEENLDQKPSVYHAVIILDVDGKMEITDEQFLLMKSYVEEKGYDMYYLGDQYLETFYRLGFSRDVLSDAENKSLMYLGSDKIGQKVQDNAWGNLYAVHGLWTKTDEEESRDEKTRLRFLKDAIICQMVTQCEIAMEAREQQ